MADAEPSDVPDATDLQWSTANWISVSEAAGRTGVTSRTLRRWINQSKVQGEQRNGRWYVNPDGLSERQSATQPDTITPGQAVIPMSELSEFFQRLADAEARAVRAEIKIDYARQLHEANLDRMREELARTRKGRRWLRRHTLKD